MNSRSILVGVCESKRPYERNMALGFGISSVIHAIAISALMLFVSYTPGPVVIDTPRLPEVIDFIPLPLPPHPNPGPVDPTSPAGPIGGIPVPVPDNEASIEELVPTQMELSLIAPETPIGLLEGNFGDDPSAVLNEILPDPGTFLPCDIMPVAVNPVMPVYPDLARRTGIQGEVWVKALIDKEGRVRDAIIAKPSGANAGFEEAAIAATLVSVWKPAIANGMPLAIWVTFKVEFKLK